MTVWYQSSCCRFGPQRCYKKSTSVLREIEQFFSRDWRGQKVGKMAINLCARMHEIEGLKKTRVMPLTFLAMADA